MASSPIVLDIGSSDDELGFPFDSSLPFPGDFSFDVDDDVVIIDELPPLITKRDKNSSDHRKRSDSSSPKTNGVSDNRKVVEDDDDCLVLDEDPNAPHPVSEKNWDDGSDDLVVVSEKGPVACRDFPHSRHMCVSFPFKETAHEKYCQMCHCYVCDVPAPCTNWGNGGSPEDHCHSNDGEPKWKFLRKNLRGVPKTLPEFAKLNGPLPQKASRCNSSSLFPVVQYTNYRSVTIQSSSHFSDAEPRARCNFNPPVPSIMRRKRPMQFQSNDEMRFSHPHPKLQKVATPLDVLASTAASARQNYRTGNPRYRCRRPDPPRNFSSITPADILQRVEDFLMDDSNHFASHRTTRNDDYIQSFENTYSAAFPPSSKCGASFALPPSFSPPPDFESDALKGLDVPPGFEAPPGFAFNSSTQFREAPVTFERNDHNCDYLYESLPFTPQPASPNFPLAGYLGPNVLDSDPSCIVTDETQVCTASPRFDEPRPPQGFTSCSDSFVAPPPIIPQHSESHVSTQFTPPGQQIDASENEHGLQRMWNALTRLPCPVEEDSYHLQ